MQAKADCCFVGASGTAPVTAGIRFFFSVEDFFFFACLCTCKQQIDKLWLLMLVFTQNPFIAWRPDPSLPPSSSLQILFESATGLALFSSAFHEEVSILISGVVRFTYRRRVILQIGHLSKAVQDSLDDVSKVKAI